jgi:hypothetical protein
MAPFFPVIQLEFTPPEYLQDDEIGMDAVKYRMKPIFA